MSRITTGLLITILAAVAPPEAFALITGGEGNKPITDPGWPAGAAAIFNHTGRIAWWEGPPFGGGQWHAECRGDAKALNAVLADFARMDAKIKRVVVHDGTGHSFWLAPNREQEKLEAAKIDWVFMVWQPASWERLRKLPADLNPTELADTAPPSQIDVYTAGINWADVTVPQGIEVIDQRLVAHGFTAEDGVVLEGKVTDLATRQPIAATMRLQRVEPQEKGGYRYPVVAEAKADAQGHWVLKKAPAGWVRVVIEADGFVPRVAGYAQVRRAAPVAVLRLRPGPPRRRLGAGHRRGRQAAGGRRRAARQRPAGVRRPLRVAARIHGQDRRRGPLPGRAGAGGDGLDLGPQAGLSRPRCRACPRSSPACC